jgi:hypothetical protein
VPTSLTAVDKVEVLQGESELGRKLVDPGSEVSLGQGSELVEEWLDYGLAAVQLAGIRDLLKVG